MGIGRRKFFADCGHAFAVAASTSTAATLLVDNLYVNRKLGFAFHKPMDWKFSDVAEMGKLAEGQILANGRRLTKEMVDCMGWPFVVVEQPLSATRGFSPNIQCYLLDDDVFHELDRLMDELDEILADTSVNAESKPKRSTIHKRCHEDLEANLEFLNSTLMSLFATIEVSATF